MNIFYIIGLLVLSLLFTGYVIICYFKDIHYKFKKKPSPGEPPAAESQMTETEAETVEAVEEIKAPEPVLMESDD